MIGVVRIDPVDVLYLRGNRLFAELGNAEPLMPPWPSLFAGALRSRMLADLGAVDRFRAGSLDGEPGAVLGSGPDSLGSFRVAFACLHRDGAPLFPLPADLVVLEDEGGLSVHRLAPVSREGLGLDASFPLPALPLLGSGARGKPRHGYLLTVEGMRTWQSGGLPDDGCLVASAALWSADARLGIALDEDRGTARDSALYTTRTVALREGVGFLVGVVGAGSLMPREGLLRLGGDGRGAAVRAIEDDAAAPWHRAPSGDRFTMLLATPGMFDSGWLPSGAGHEDGLVAWRWGDLRAEILSGSVGRAGVASGWDLARGEPKPARRIVQAGSVYWMKRLDGDTAALDRVRCEGLWASGSRDPRRAEGFGSVWFGDWAETDPVTEG